MARSALGPNTPHRDLFLSGGHRLYLDGVLIPVVDLLNNVTIARWCAEDLPEIEYFHIKLNRHSVIYAEGAACDTLQTVTAANWDNFEEYRRLYGEPSDEAACAPVLGYNGRRSMVRSHLRSAISPVIDFAASLTQRVTIWSKEPPHLLTMHPIGQRSFYRPAGRVLTMGRSSSSARRNHASRSTLDRAVLPRLRHNRARHTQGWAWGSKHIGAGHRPRRLSARGRPPLCQEPKVT